ncbi:histidinol dehydrogenase [Haloplasma contractile]|uniref:Histidinol dehydrogenase n=1 Tax=Haloplasma contractile SSD-17B TaxID=1033810 RepID=U2FL51_9MOLU|nr:histidinol dehydrogenase [Haloplasma contractile]ERJ11934.1 Histidinol dehydrogenase protein [Haloplasma contractile SSD-17B]
MIEIIELNNNSYLMEKLTNRTQFEYKEVNQVVEDIIEEVKNKQDQAVRYYTEKFDSVSIDDFLVGEREIKQAFKSICPKLKSDLERARDNILLYHKEQLTESYTITKENATLSQRVRPIEKVGIYVPGGSASYPSTVLMNAIPAKLAGVSERIMITPPSSDGTIKDSILVAASLAGVTKIYKIGGAQGIAALAYGTETIPKVSKIVGPGNIYVAMAKKKVSGYVGIDMVAGPSEILIIADETANPDYVAADLMSQAEHDPLAAAILVTDSNELALKVQASLNRQVETLERTDIIKQSLRDYGAIVVTKNITEAVDLANEIAPEHLELLTKDPFTLSSDIVNAGAIFIGEYTPEPVGDYFAGPNHTLPTSGTAKFSSPLSVTDFIKKTSVIYYDRQTLVDAKDSIIRIARDEGLTAHANAIEIRFRNELE